MGDGDTTLDDSSEDGAVPGVDDWGDTPEEVFGLYGVVDSTDAVGYDCETAVEGQGGVDAVLEDADVDNGFLPCVVFGDGGWGGGGVNVDSAHVGSSRHDDVLPCLVGQQRGDC